MKSPGCQRHALEVAACVRGADLPAMPIETVVLEPDAYTAAFVGEVDPAEAKLQPAENALRRALALFGASSPPVDRRSDWAAQAVGTIGFYDRATNRITLRADQAGGAGDDDARENAMLLLVHEMTHALQAAENAFTPRAEVDNSDASLARRAITEGDARLTEMRAYAQRRGTPEADVIWPRWFANMETYYLGQARSTTDLYRDRALLFPYVYGARFLHRRLEREGNLGVQALVRGPSPLTTREIWDVYADSRPPARRARDLPVASLPEPWKLSSVSHLGAWFVARMLDRKGIVLDASNVSGDALTVLEIPEGGEAPALAAFWRIEIEISAGGFELRRQVEDRMGVQATYDGDALVLAAFTGPVGGPARVPTWVAQTQPDLYFEPEAAAAPPHHGCAHPRMLHGSR